MANIINDYNLVIPTEKTKLIVFAVKKNNKS